MNPKDLIEGGLLKSSDLEGALPSEQGAELGTLGRYELLEVLGRGGSAIVYRARDPLLNRDVALKRLRFVDPELETRFLREAGLLARLSHPGIMPVFDFGREGESIYYTMPLAPGLTLDLWVAERQADPREAARVVREAAEAIAHAHEHGVLHRDVKPANILVSAEGKALVADFGLGRAEDPDLREAGRVTVSGDVMGTPSYMAPEIMTGGLKRVDARCDVYSLGATLYEALAGAPPFVGGTTLEILRRIEAEEPASPRKLAPGIPPDLEVICLKALEKDPARRYATARELANDLGRFLAGEPIRARRASPMYRLRRQIARRKALVAALVVALAVAGIAAVAPAIRRWQRGREAAAAIDRATRMREEGRLEEAYAELAPAGELARELRADIVLALSGYETSWERPAHASGITGVGFAAGGSRIVSGGRDSKLRYWDAATGAPIHEVQAHGGLVTALDVSPDGMLVATAGDDRRVKLWRSDSGALVREWRAHDTVVNRIRFSPDGATLASGAQDGSIRLWPSTEGPPRELSGPKGGIRALAFSPDGEAFAAGGEEDRIFLWNLRSGEPSRTFQGHVSWTRCLAFAPDGGSLIAGFAGSVLRKVDLKTGGSSPEWKGHTGFLSEISTGPGGAIAWTSAEDRTVRIWDTAAGKTLAILPPHPDEVLTFAIQGRRLVTGCRDGTLRCSERRWEFGSGPDLPGPETILDLSADGKGGLYATRYAESELRLERPGGPGERIMTLGASSLDARIAQGPREPSTITIHWLQGTNAQPVEVLKAAVRRDGGWIVEDIDGDDAGGMAACAVDSDGTVHAVYNVRKEKLRHARRGPDGPWEVKDLGPLPPRMTQFAVLAGPKGKGPEIIVALDRPLRLVSIPVKVGAADGIPDWGDPWYGRITAWRDDSGRLYGLVWADSDLVLLSEASEGWRVRRFALSGEQGVKMTGWTAPDGSIDVRWITSTRGRVRTARLPSK
jgi:tRNA A-37 threonylcarbamoyl transferase component Bud32